MNKDNTMKTKLVLQRLMKDVDIPTSDSGLLRINGLVSYCIGMEGYDKYCEEQRKLGDVCVYEEYFLKHLNGELDVETLGGKGLESLQSVSIEGFKKKCRDTLHDWKRSPDTKQLIEAGMELEGLERDQIIYSERNPNSPRFGTWVHPNLIRDLVSWCNASLAWELGSIISEALREGTTLGNTTFNGMVDVVMETVPDMGNLFNTSSHRRRQVSQKLSKVIDQACGIEGKNPKDKWNTATSEQLRQRAFLYRNIVAMCNSGFVKDLDQLCVAVLRSKDR